MISVIVKEIVSMHLVDLIPDADVLCALEPEELGLYMLPYLLLLQRSPAMNLSLESTLQVQQHYAGPRSNEVGLAIREAWAWLNGVGFLIENPNFMSPNTLRILSRKAMQLAQEKNPLKAGARRHLPKEILHPTIRDDVWSLFHRNKFDTAVFEAMKAVEVAVREAAGLDDSDIGRTLVRRAFDVTKGPLTDMKADSAERQATSDLFAGAIGSYKNPQSHRRVNLSDAGEAEEIIMLANHLLRLVDTRRSQSI